MLAFLLRRFPIIELEAPGHHRCATVAILSAALAPASQRIRQAQDEGDEATAVVLLVHGLGSAR